jgi:hypothetical protein
VSLASVGQWIRSLGRLNPDEAFSKGMPLPPRTIPQDPEIAALSVTLKQSFRGSVSDKERKTMTAIRHTAILEKTPVEEGETPMALDVHEAEWLPRMS